MVKRVNEIKGSMVRLLEVNEAMKLFEAVHPQHLVTEMRLTDKLR